MVEQHRAHSLSASLPSASAHGGIAPMGVLHRREDVPGRSWHARLARASLWSTTTFHTLDMRSRNGVPEPDQRFGQRVPLGAGTAKEQIR